MLDVNEARDDGVTVAGPYADHLHLAPVMFYRAVALPAAQPTASMH